MISVAGISKSFGEKKVLDGVSFSVEDGEIFGLLGPSGAGKTTLIRVLTGQLRFEEGDAMVMGKRVSQLSGADKKQFGIMMDDFGLYERLTCYQNLRVFADIYGVDDAAIRTVLQEVALLDAEKKEVKKLSKGMKERLRLARALLARPKVLFLDEPTSGLDPQTSSEIHEIIRKRKNAGTIIFLTTHNMTEAEKLCDHLVLLNE
ncbi:MAG: ABC transporter ATP-binding protein, partial [Clostridiales bacterium]|nr:ABC transporter ATP-binding protein [Clostridiales bacterium]